MTHSVFQITVALVVLAGAIHSGVRADDKSTVVETSKTDNPEVKLKTGTWKDVEALVAKSKGKLVVVDVWSTSCLPCMTEFPHLVELHKKYGEKIVCVSFNVDYVGIKSRPVTKYEKKVEEFLQKHNAICTNFLSSMPSGEVFQSLELSSIPAAYVYGTDGTLLKRFDDSLLVDGKEEAFTYKEDINPYIEGLLKDVK
ncbi:MAG TPA: TlpA family protein disulfide reductase [Planctomycetaceae bacterium]|nr:TlpA family protein disulfide reductase [Planctomycetaceae bacterium]